MPKQLGDGQVINPLLVLGTDICSSWLDSQNVLMSDVYHAELYTTATAVVRVDKRRHQ